MPKNVKERSQGTKFVYLSRDVVSNACSEIMENILLKTYEEENPFRDEEGLIVVHSKTFVSDGVDSLTSIPTITDEKVKNIMLPELPEEKQHSLSSLLPKKSTRIGYFQTETTNPFAKELTLKKSEDISNDAKSVTDQIFEEYDALEGMSISSEMVLEKPASPPRKMVTFLSPESTIQLTECSRDAGTSNSNTSRDVSVQNSLVTLCQRVQLDAKTLMTDPQAQGDFGMLNDNSLYNDSFTSVNISINFALYAKLLAFLLTINTLIFFKTVVWTMFWKLFDIYMRIR